MASIRNLAKRALKRAASSVLGSDRASDAASAPTPAPSPAPSASPAPAPAPTAARSAAAPGGPGPSGTARFADLDELHETVFGEGSLRLVNHWATWCSGCVDELALLVQLHEALGEQVKFLGVSWEGFQGDLLGQDLLDEVQACATSNGLRWPSLLVEAPPPEFFDRFELDCQTIPQVWLVDRDGTVLHRIEHPLEPADAEELKTRIAAAL